MEDLIRTFCQGGSNICRADILKIHKFISYNQNEVRYMREIAKLMVSYTNTCMETSDRLYKDLLDFKDFYDVNPFTATEFFLDTTFEKIACKAANIYLLRDEVIGHHKNNTGGVSIHANVTLVAALQFLFVNKKFRPYPDIFKQMLQDAQDGLVPELKHIWQPQLDSIFKHVVPLQGTSNAQQAVFKNRKDAYKTNAEIIASLVERINEFEKNFNIFNERSIQKFRDEYFQFDLLQDVTRTFFSIFQGWMHVDDYVKRLVSEEAFMRKMDDTMLLTALAGNQSIQNLLGCLESDHIQRMTNLYCGWQRVFIRSWNRSFPGNLHVIHSKS